MTLLRSEDEMCQRMAAMSLANMASNIRNQPKLLAEVRGEARRSTIPGAHAQWFL
jgi:hypothetical protein